MTAQARVILGADPEERLVAVEHRLSAGAGADEVELYVRDGAGAVKSRREPFAPFLWLENEALQEHLVGLRALQPLAGRNPLRFLAEFGRWKDIEKSVQSLKAATGQPPSSPAAPYFFLNDPVEQHLLRSGRTLYKGLRFDQLRRLHVDIETYTDGGYDFPNPAVPNHRVIAIALGDETGWTEVLGGRDGDEAGLLRRFVAVVRERDPDVLVGHNLFKFDLPYLAERARRHGVKLQLGRDGSEPRVRASRWVVADRTIAYPRFDIAGRQVVDTYFLLQLYDVTHRALDGFGLKDAARHFGLAAPGRTYIAGADIARTFDQDPGRLLRYARDDIIETGALAALLLPLHFAQAQILPFSLQNVCVRGSAAKIDALLLREYLRAGQAVARPQPGRNFEGGYTDIFQTGVLRNVHHVDVRSLYPSLLLAHRWGPRSDELGAFLELLEYLRTYRLQARDRQRQAAEAAEAHYLDALQSGFKVLINSFYGYLGFSQARFNDYAAAERVAAEGRRLLKQMIAGLQALGARPVEIDTDGIYFMPPEFKTDRERDAFRDAFRAELPPGIEVEFDGEYVAMFSHKMKNYALLDAKGELIVKGAALKSRGLEPFQRQYLRDALRLRLEGREAELPALQARTRRAVEQREWPIQMLAKSETLQKDPAAYLSGVAGKSRGRNAAYELALNSGREYHAGDVVSYYMAGAKKNTPVHEQAKLVADWRPGQRDENVPYYLAKLEKLFRKLESAGDEETPEDAAPAE